MSGPGARPRTGAGAESTSRQEQAALWVAFFSSRRGVDPVGPWVELARARLESARALAVFGYQEGAPALEQAWPQGYEADDSVCAAVAEGFGRGMPLIRSSPRGFVLLCPLPAERRVVLAEVDSATAQRLRQLLDELLLATGWLAAGLAARRAERSEARAQRVELAARLSENVAREKSASAAALALAAGVGAAFQCSEVRVGVSRQGNLMPAARWSREEAGHDDAGSADEREIRRQEVLGAAVLAGRALSIPFVPASGEPPTQALEVSRHTGPESAGVAGDSGCQENMSGNGVASAGEGACEGAAGSIDGLDGEPGPIEFLSRTAALCAVPLVLPEGAAGALLLERSAGPAFTEEEAATLDAIALQVAPLLQSLPMRRPSVTTERRAFVALFGPVRLRFKLALVVLLAAALVLTGATGDYVVPAAATVEGSPARAVQAPFSGVLAELMVRHGDRVRRGQVLARLQDAQPHVQRVESGTSPGQSARPGEPGDGGVAAAEGAAQEGNEASARAMDERRSRARIVSPVDGVVTGGPGFDLVGEPVEQGQSLLEISLVDTYRLVLWMDERNLVHVREGQAGRVDLGGGGAVPFTVRRITGETEPAKGGQRVRLEAELQAPSEHAIPGAEGSAEVAVGKRKLVWIWWRALQREIAAW